MQRLLILFLCFFTLSSQMYYQPNYYNHHNNRQNTYMPPSNNLRTNDRNNRGTSRSSSSHINQKVYDRFNASKNSGRFIRERYSNPTTTFRNITIRQLINDFQTLTQSITQTNLNRVLSLGTGSSLLHQFTSQLTTLYFNLWCHRQLIISSLRSEFYVIFIIPQVQRLLQTEDQLRRHILSYDKFTSKQIVIKGDQNVLTTSGRIEQEDFTSIVGRNIIVNGLGNIVAGEEITLEGEQSFVLGRNLAYKGSGGVVVTNNKDVVGDQRMLLGEFIIEIDSYRNDRTVKLVQDNYEPAL